MSVAEFMIYLFSNRSENQLIFFFVRSEHTGIVFYNNVLRVVRICKAFYLMTRSKILQ